MHCRDGKKKKIILNECPQLLVEPNGKLICKRPHENKHLTDPWDLVCILQMTFVIVNKKIDMKCIIFLLGFLLSFPEMMKQVCLSFSLSLPQRN